MSTYSCLDGPIPGTTSLSATPPSSDQYLPLPHCIGDSQSVLSIQNAKQQENKRNREIQGIVATALNAQHRRSVDKSKSNASKRNIKTTKDATQAAQDAQIVGATGSLTIEGVRRCVLSEYYEPANPSVPIEKLKKIHTKDLTVGKHHRGTFLKVHITSTAATVDSAVQAVFQDEECSYGILRVYWADWRGVPYKILLRHQVIVIRDPFLWDPGYDDAADCPLIRVDHPSDMIFANDWEVGEGGTAKYVPRIWLSKMDYGHSFEEILILAEDIARLSDARTAARYFNMADSKADGLKPVLSKGAPYTGNMPADDPFYRLKYGRGNVLLKFALYYQALRDAQAILHYYPQDNSAGFLKARALLSAGKWDEGLELSEEIYSRNRKNLLFVSLVTHARQRAKEYHEGIYNFDAVRREALTGTVNVALDQLRADYTVPVKLKRTSQTTRQVVTTRSVRRGDILMCVRAVVSMRGDEAGRFVLYNCHDSTDEVGNGAIFTAMLLEALDKPRSKWEAELWGLDDGGYGAKIPVYKNPDGSRTRDVFHLNEIRRRHTILSTNIPILQDTSRTLLPPAPPTEIYHTNSLFILPSYLTHSCLPNTQRAIIGNMMVVRALHDLPEGTILTADKSMDVSPHRLNFGTPMCKCPSCNSVQAGIHSNTSVELSPELLLRRTTLYNEITQERDRISFMNMNTTTTTNDTTTPVALSSAKLRPLDNTFPNLEEKVNHLIRLHQLTSYQAAPAVRPSTSSSTTPHSSLPGTPSSTKAHPNKKLPKNSNPKVPAVPIPTPGWSFYHRFLASGYIYIGQRRHAQCALYRILDSHSVQYAINTLKDRVYISSHGPGEVTEYLLHAYRDLSMLATTRGQKRDWFMASREAYKLLMGEADSYFEVLGEVDEDGFVEAKVQCDCFKMEDIPDLYKMAQKAAAALANMKGAAGGAAGAAAAEPKLDAVMQMGVDVWRRLFDTPERGTGGIGVGWNWRFASNAQALLKRGGPLPPAAVGLGGTNSGYVEYGGGCGMPNCVHACGAGYIAPHHVGAGGGGTGTVVGVSVEGEIGAEAMGGEERAMREILEGAVGWSLRRWIDMRRNDGEEIRKRRGSI